MLSLVLLIYNVYHHLYHNVLLLRSVFGNHQGEGLFLYRWVKFHTGKGLINLSYAALEGIVLLVGKPLAA